MWEGSTVEGESLLGGFQQPGWSKAYSREDRKQQAKIQGQSGKGWYKARTRVLSLLRLVVEALAMCLHECSGIPRQIGERESAAGKK